jgi:DNA-binding response OmpR family regulator
MSTILLLEDHPLIRENIAEMLMINSMEVVECENGNEGLLALKGKLPDLILCDIMMPELDGYEFLVEIKKNKRTAKIPFIFLSAKTEKKEMQIGIDLGADSYLTKPFDQTELMAKIESFLPIK